MAHLNNPVTSEEFQSPGLTTLSSLWDEGFYQRIFEKDNTQSKAMATSWLFGAPRTTSLVDKGVIFLVMIIGTDYHTKLGLLLHNGVKEDIWVYFAIVIKHLSMDNL